MNGSFPRSASMARRRDEGTGTAVSRAAGWPALGRELDAWAEAGRTATLWWRDDDAIEPTPALDRLLAIRGESGIPLSLAVIPADVDAGLAGIPDAVTVVQHGITHRNLAPSHEKKAELTSGRIRPEDLAAGRRRLADMFGGRFLPILVPPWNRIDPVLVPMLAKSGFTGLSTFGRRRSAEPAPGIRQVNCHVDIVDWHGTRGFIGEQQALAQAVGHLAARRRGEADGDEPTGLLTHHLVHDAECWRFVAGFLARTRGHPAVRWIGIGEGVAV